MPRALPTFFLFPGLLLAAVFAAAEGEVPPSLAAADQSRHAALAARLPADQLAALGAAYPGFRVLQLCPGRFSGAAKDEAVLGLWHPAPGKGARGPAVSLAALLWDGERWQVRDVVADVSADPRGSSGWTFGFAEDGFSGATKCGIDKEFRGDSDLTYELGDKPVFDLRKSGLKGHKVICYSTSNEYNNWDCAVYVPKAKRFKLWYRQAHAD